jgi:hypothetical protein
MIAASDQRIAPRRPSRRLILAALFLPILLSACGGESTRPKYVPEIVLFGYLYIGESVSDTNAICLEQTRPVDQHYDAEEAAIRDAIVTLRADSAGVADTLRMVAPGRYASHADPAIKIRARTTYHLEARIGGRTITATTTTPNVFTTVREPRVVPGTMRQASIADSFPIVVECADPEQIFLVDVYCLEDWQNARFVHHLGSPEDHSQSYDEYGGDNGEPRHIMAYFRLKDVERTETGLPLFSFYGDMMWFFGSYQVGVLSLDQNYYSYLYREHPERNGGVHGGIGVFGSACRRQYLVETVE